MQVFDHKKKEHSDIVWPNSLQTIKKIKSHTKMSMKGDKLATSNQYLISVCDRYVLLISEGRVVA